MNSFTGPVVPGAGVYNSPYIEAYIEAVGGTACSDALALYPTNVARRYRPEAGARNVASLGCGTNDYIHGKTEAATYADILAYVVAAKATGFTVIVNTVPSAAQFGPAAGNTWRNNLNALITGGAAGNGYLVADEAADANIGCQTCYLNTTYFTDQVHMTTAGYAIKGGITAAVLSSLGFN
jgi:hypothetical protein